MFRPVGKPRVAEEIVQQLRTLILRGHYAVGDKLPPERKLAEELGVNRASLREAIKALEQMGLVKTRQGDGTRVLDFMQTAGLELISHLITDAGAQTGGPNVGILLDVLDFRRWFGRESARLAAERATEEDVKTLEQIAEKAADPALDAGELLKLDFDFYLALTNASKNAVMKLLINTMRPAIMNYAPFFAQYNAPAQVVRKHQRDILKAIAAKDGDAAFKASDAYLKRGIETVQALLKPAAS
jgi:GntR family transcriptional repressor for pyruvate dehydrogenase complex